MGRFIGNGLATTISIKRSYPDFQILEYKKEIFDSIGKVIDLGLYDVTEYTSGFELHLKVDLINRYLKDLLREVSFNEEHINVLLQSYKYKNLDQLNDFWDCDFSVKLDKNQYYELRINDRELSREECLLGECFNQVYLRDRKNDYPIFISVCIIPFGMDYDEIMMEDETYLLYLLNMDLKRYQNPLSTAFIYGIIG